MTSDGVPISFHAIIVVQVTDSVSLIKNFGPNWYSNNLQEQFATMVRQAVRKRGMNETAISTTALDAIDAEIRDALTAFIKDKVLPVRLVTMTVGRANPPDAIKNQRIETATQEQRIQTERQTKLAEDERMKAEQSRANARATPTPRVDAPVAGAVHPARDHQDATEPSAARARPAARSSRMGQRRS